MHHEIADRTAALATTVSSSPRRVLDVGCGTGYLLGRLSEQYPEASALAGIDAAPTMVEVAMARRLSRQERLGFGVGVAEELPFPNETFDLGVSTTSFDHWSDQERGLEECRRVLSAGGRFVLVDQFSNWLIPTLAVSRRAKGRTLRRTGDLLAHAGFRSIRWQRLYASIINAATATA
jgi:ubiquinone/menaquinone biosynthesis C-methylase UbiE